MMNALNSRTVLVSELGIAVRSLGQHSTYRQKTTTAGPEYVLAGLAGSLAVRQEEHGRCC